MTAQHREALSGLVYSVRERRGLTVLVGEAGTGKTTLLSVLRGWLEKERLVTALCTNPMLTREELFDLLMVQFDVACSSPFKNRQLVALQETLLRHRADGRHAVFVVDEAQRLSPELLEDIRLLLNLETPQEKLLEIILSGQPELTEILRRPELRQLKQRVSCMCKLEPLSLEELREYLYHRLAQAGLSQQCLFPEEAIPVIFEYTRGIPRLVNSLCDSALQTGFGLRSPSISISIIREAASDLDLHSNRKEMDWPSNGSNRAAGPPHSNGIQTGWPSNGNNREAGSPRAALPERASPVSFLGTPEGYAARQKSLGFLANLFGKSVVD
jgi:general secretion pathway protein A